jgi:hypothetical protein
MQDLKFAGLWKAFFYLWLILLISSIYYSLTEGKLEKLSGAINLLQLLLGAIAIYGLAFQKRILVRGFWRVMFILQLTFIVIVLTLFGMATGTFVQSLGVMKLVAGIAALLLVLAPYYYGLYLYSYRSNAIWANK